MQYMLLLHSEERGWDQIPAEERTHWVGAFQAFVEALSEAGAFIDSNRLEPSHATANVRVVDGKTQVVDGPYVDSKEQFGGYFLIDVPDHDAAIAWAARCPGALYGNVEVRPVGVSILKPRLKV